MKAAIHNPYLDSLGGGERYTMAVASFLIKAGFEVDIEWFEESIKEKIESRFGINTQGMNFVPEIKRGDGYDLCFWVSDGSVPLLKARKNLLHFQIPFRNVDGRSLLNKMKFLRVNKVVCNSGFTKESIDKEFGVDSYVIYPPVDTRKIRPGKKENIVLYVGRFSRLQQLKRQDILVDVFKKFYDTGNRDWTLVLAGGSEVGGGDLIEELKVSSKSYPVKIIENPDFNTLCNLYGKAKFFWSAAGYGIDEEKSPEKVEHLGITVLEAMSGGAIPLVYSAGGHKEIIKDEINGFLWNQVDELAQKSQSLLKNNNLYKKMLIQAQEDAKKYSYQRFEDEFSGI